jgi:hypothetical protein
MTLALVAPFLAAAACGGGSSGGSSTGSSSSTSGSSGGGVNATKACNDEAAAICSLRDSCSGGYTNKRVFGSEAVCQARTAQTCINALDAPGTGNTPAAVEACAAAYPSEACTDFFDVNNTACPQQMGTRAMGATCAGAGQCTSGFCAVTQYTVCGTCQPAPAVGATCQVQADCGRDLACAFPTVSVGDAGVPTSGRCAAFVPSGGTCLTGYMPCEAGLACVGDNQATMKTGTCQAAGATMGAACQTTRQTAANCDPDRGLVCIPTQPVVNNMGTCQPISLVGAGMPCGVTGTPETSFAVCSANGLCKKPAPTDLAGTCVAAAMDGMACDNDPSLGPPCLTPAKCVMPAGSPGTAGTCMVPNGTTCM